MSSNTLLTVPLWTVNEWHLLQNVRAFSTSRSSCTSSRVAPEASVSKRWQRETCRSSVVSEGAHLCCFLSCCFLFAIGLWSVDGIMTPRITVVSTGHRHQGSLLVTLLRLSATRCFLRLRYSLFHRRCPDNPPRILCPSVTYTLNGSLGAFQIRVGTSVGAKYVSVFRSDRLRTTEILVSLS